MKLFSFSVAVDRPARIDTIKALMWGLIWFIFATIFMWYFRLVPHSVVTVGASGYVPLWGVLLLHASVWVSAGAVMFALAAIVGRSVKMGDIMGRVLYARAPFYLLLVPLAWTRFRVPFSVLMYDPAAAVQAYSGMVVPYLIFAALIAVWWLVWNYKAFVAAAHRRSVLVAAAFAVSLPLSYLLSAAVAEALLKSW